MVVAKKSRAQIPHRTRPTPPLEAAVSTPSTKASAIPALLLGPSLGTLAKVVEEPGAIYSPADRRCVQRRGGMRKYLLVPVLYALSACGSGASQAQSDSEPTKVATSGKVDVPLAEVPADVVAAATAAQPGFTPAEAE